MKDEEIDSILAKASSRPPDKVSPALAERIADSIKPSLTPVRALPPGWLLTGGLLLICAAVAVAGAARAGFNGVENLAPLERWVIFVTLGVLACASGKELVSEAVPGRLHTLSPSVLLSVVCVTLLGVFALLFRDYRTEHFVSAGVACLLTGLLHALPVGLLSWLLLRRGFAVDPVSAGVAGGALAGLGGVTMLELHCSNFEAPHVLLWHTAVVPVSALCGAIVGWAIARRRETA